MYRFLYQKGLVEGGFPWNSLDAKKDGTPSFSMFYEPPWNTMELSRSIIGAGNETRTRDLNLGKVALYQLSYSRAKQRRNCRAAPAGVKNNRGPVQANTLK